MAPNLFDQFLSRLLGVHMCMGDYTANSIFLSTLVHQYVFFHNK